MKKTAKPIPHPQNGDFIKRRPLNEQVAGTYEVKCQYTNWLTAACNGEPFGDSKMVFDGEWCRFYQDGKQVFNCNPNYAFWNFYTKPA